MVKIKNKPNDNGTLQMAHINIKISTVPPHQRQPFSSNEVDWVVALVDVQLLLFPDNFLRLYNPVPGIPVFKYVPFFPIFTLAPFVPIVVLTPLLLKLI